MTSIFINAKSDMSQKHLIIGLFLFFTATTVFLFWQNNHELDPDQGKNWWTFSFTAPEREESLSFFIENHSDKTNFQYEVAVGKEVISKDTFIAKPGEKTTVTLPFIAKQKERVKITVTTGNEKKEIYR